MASAAGRTAVIDAGPFLVHAWFGMRQVEACRDPGCGRMAFGAIGVERSKVEIRVGMAGYTLGREPCKLAAGMAGFTSYINVRAVQWEVAAVVVEGYLFPVKGGMAGSAVRAKATSMFIILAVAGITIAGRALINTTLVTIFASNVSMLAFQLESREIVVKGRILPAISYMAGTAICSKARRVRIICAMTGIAVLRCSCKISKLTRVKVTLDTGHFPVLPCQFKLGNIMIESFAESVHPIVTVEAGRSVGQDMCPGKDSVHLTVAGIA